MSGAFIISICLILGFAGGYGVGYPSGYSESAKPLELEAAFLKGEISGAYKAMKKMYGTQT